ncbi:MAG: redoxin domain-containing protein [Rhodospirillaceae bacterium]|nr:redoxin domain-containing protein [Rhodospirillaceae bacterium]
MRKLMFAFAGLVLATAAAGAREPQLGKPAPDFTGTDTKGAAVRLADFKGKLVVLEWSNHECPYVRKHYGSGNMQKTQAAARALGVEWITIISSAPGNQGYVEAAEADRLTKARSAQPSVVLLDPKGKIGRLYEARVTPHMFIVGKDGNLLYKGGIDSIRSSRVADIDRAKNYVTAALGEISAGKQIADADTTAYGCTIHYRDES